MVCVISANSSNNSDSSDINWKKQIIEESQRNVFANNLLHQELSISRTQFLKNSVCQELSFSRVEFIKS